MFFGNMQSFYRRNSNYSSSSSQSSKQSKENIKRKHLIKNKKEEKNDDYRSRNTVTFRRNSFSISRNDDQFEDDAETRGIEQRNLPVIKIGMYEPETSKKSASILKKKEKALWHNSAPALNDNSERLGPNKNNIIEETLEFERRKSGEWGH